VDELTFRLGEYSRVGAGADAEMTNWTGPVMDDGMAISDHAFLSDCSSAALVDRHGSINWWCVPRFDSSSVLGRLLDPEAGHWKVQPATDFWSERHYVGDSLVLRTTFHTSSGAVAVTDALALAAGARGHDIGIGSPHVLLRRIEGVSGFVVMLSELAPRMEYGRTEPHLIPTEDGVRAMGGPTRLTCTGSIDMLCQDGNSSRVSRRRG
jgi:GH15 family glucan-1,4-alpha-glucosidase